MCAVKKSKKMKANLFTIGIISILAIAAQSQDPLTFEDVVYVDSLIGKEELFNRGNQWIVSIFKNPQKVIQLSDREEGQIICKGNFEYNQKKFIWGGSETTKGYINFTIKLFFKEGRYKYIFTDFFHEPINQGNSFGLITAADEFQGKMPLTSKGWRKWIWDDIKEQIVGNVETMKSSLIEQMEKKSESVNDDW